MVDVTTRSVGGEQGVCDYLFKGNEVGLCDINIPLCFSTHSLYFVGMIHSY